METIETVETVKPIETVEREFTNTLGVILDQEKKYIEMYITNPRGSRCRIFFHGSYKSICKFAISMITTAIKKAIWD